MKKNTVIVVLSLALVVFVIISASYGCSFNMFEKFEDVEHEDEHDDKKQAEKETAHPSKKAEATGLTPKEKEMFENIRNGNLTDEDIQKFISDGRLTEKMVEKFLEHIDAMPMPPAEKDDEKNDAAPKKPVAKPANKSAAPEAEEGFDIEGFSGSMYAKF